jgi:heptosyltransferase II
MTKVLIIQTAFIGDVILATPLIEKIHETYPHAQVDFLLRKGNEGLLENHPLLRGIIIWDKKKGKYAQLKSLVKLIRAERYDYAINLQRFLTTGLITVLSGAKQTVGFNKNPLSVFFSRRYPHMINKSDGRIHEVERNLSLIGTLVPNSGLVRPKLYPSPANFEKVKQEVPYVSISPTSVWFTKQYPLEKWIKVIDLISPQYKVFLLGGKIDEDACLAIRSGTSHPQVVVMAGMLSFLESAALMKGAAMNYVNDSAPMHLASAMDAPVTAIFCSTIPAFGFGPLSTHSEVLETDLKLDCRPCGLHGYKACPQKHFKCSGISPERIVMGLAKC